MQGLSAQVGNDYVNVIRKAIEAAKAEPTLIRVKTIVSHGTFPGHLGSGKLVAFGNGNGVTIDGRTEPSVVDNGICGRIESTGLTLMMRKNISLKIAKWYALLQAAAWP